MWSYRNAVAWTRQHRDEVSQKRATARIRAVNGLRQGRNYTANIVRLGRVAVRRHELAAALRVVQEWEAL